MNRLPFEVIFQIFEYLPLSDYKTLYDVFPQQIIDEGLIFKLRNNKKKTIIHLVSTNVHELASNSMNKKNESFISLYYASFDPIHRAIWFLPDFSNHQHYFRVKDAYVSHGKLVIRNPVTTDTLIPLTSLWDIRKVFPPSRAGSFSGASEYSTKMTSQELTLYQSTCILDSCLIPTVSNTTHVLTLEKKQDGLKRPTLPSHYSREIPKKTPINTTPFYIPTTTTHTCGYFLVERLATSISTFLDLHCK